MAEKEPIFQNKLQIKSKTQVKLSLFNFTKLIADGRDQINAKHKRQKISFIIVRTIFVLR